ncbi:Hypothetical Protein FCC1311_020612 [Hondaea fermentalgiana]|uniref:Uncharacterized protein n=1 Tax=Hondaea fermentalgiana TaxID=2315210 RepID=A0A2R5G485_9STRA|nr:Hypothetical Protein FCC1311_020612 [Hondaea fermentalgiana]|eukprot:GBG25842.1 Hypothetical Protein FCC1311_020612 [Hondaea fermentalgiana]
MESLEAQIKSDTGELSFEKMVKAYEPFTIANDDLLDYGRIARVTADLETSSTTNAGHGPAADANQHGKGGKASGGAAGNAKSNETTRGAHGGKKAQADANFREIRALKETLHKLEQENQSLQQEAATRRKKEEDLKSMERVMMTFDGIRAQLEAQRGDLQKKLAAKEASVREMQDKLDQALRARASPVPATPSEANAALKAHADILEEEVGRLQKELDASITEATAARHDASMKSIDLEVKEAQEAYLKVRIENMEADLASKDNALQTKTLQVAELSAVAQHLQFQLQLQVQAQAQAQAQMQAYVAATQASQANNAMLHPLESKSEVLPESVGPPNNVKHIPDAHLRSDADAASSLDVASLDEALALDTGMTAAPDALIAHDPEADENQEGALEDETERRDEDAEGEDLDADGQDDEVEVEAENNDDDDDDDVEEEEEEEDEPAWLFALASSERARFIDEMEFSANEVTVLDSIAKLDAWVRGDLGRFIDTSEASDRLAGLDAWGEAFCRCLRDLLAELCNRDICIILHVQSERDGDPKTVSTANRHERLFVNLVANAYESASDPGKVILGLEGWSGTQVPVDYVLGEDSPTSGGFHKVVSFASWTQASSPLQ